MAKGHMVYDSVASLSAFAISQKESENHRNSRYASGGLMPRLSFRTTTNVVFAMALAALATFGFLSFRETARLVQSERWASQTREVLETSISMSGHLSDAVAARRGFLLFRRPQALEDFSTARKRTLADLSKLQGLTSGNSSQQQLLHVLGPLVHSRLTILGRSIELHQRTRGANDSDAQAAMSQQGLELSGQISELQRSFHDAASGLLRQRLADEAATAAQTFRIETALAVLFFGALIAALIFVNREISLRDQAERASKEAAILLRSVLDSSGDAIVVSDNEGNIILRNAVMERYHNGRPFNVPLESWPEAFGIFQRDKKTLVPAGELSLVRAAFHGESVDNEEVYIRPSRSENGRWHLASARPLLNTAGRLRGGIVVLRDINDRKLLEEDRDRLIVELYKSLEKVKTLTGLLPICAGCKKIRNDQGYWTHVEDYIAQHSDATFTHGLCPDCVSGLYPEVPQKGENK